MENVSQALLMAGGVLIAIIILTMGVYLFMQAVALPENYENKLEQEKLAAFNSKFEVFNRQDVSAQDIVTVINMAIQNNRKYDISETDYYITIYLGENEINDYDEAEKITMLQATEIKDEHLVYPYKCDEITYSPNSGRVVSMKFTKE